MYRLQRFLDILLVVISIRVLLVISTYYTILLFMFRATDIMFSALIGFCLFNVHSLYYVLVFEDDSNHKCLSKS